jgi:hypothetical protein
LEALVVTGRGADTGRSDRWLEQPAVTRIVLVGGIGLLLAVVAGGVFGNVEWPLLAGPVLVTLAAIAVRDRDRIWRATAAGTATIAAALVVVLAAGGSPADIVRGVVDGPSQLLTTEWPSPAVPSVLATVALLLGLVTAAAGELAGRPRWHLAPLVPLGIGFVTMLAFGAPTRPAPWLLAVGGLLVAGLALVPAGEPVASRVRMLVGDRTLIVTALAVGAVASATAAVVAFAERADPRRVESADVIAALLDPVQASSALRAAEPPFTLFEIANTSTLADRRLPSRWRLAALDQYDGQRWVPQITLRPIGGQLGRMSSAGAATEPLAYELTYLTDDIDLVPFPGRPLSVDVPVETDLDRVAVRLGDAPSVGLRVRAESEVAPMTSSIGSTFVTRPVDEIAGLFTERARQLAGDGDLIEQLQRIESTMRDDWALDADAPGGGQQLALMERFVADTQRGTREQFVTAFVLLVRSLGVDSRVASGFIAPTDSMDSPLRLESADAAVWPEVHRSAEGWVAFDPVPPIEDDGPDDDEQPLDAQSPAAAQPPIQPPSNEDRDDDESPAVEESEESRWSQVLGVVGRTAALTGFAVLPLLLATGAILGLKWRRRRSRLQHPDPAVRVRGAWANTTDSLVDAGLTIALAWTDDRIATRAVALAPAAPHELRRLAAMSSAVTFGPGDDAALLVDDAATASRLIDAALRSERTRWQRVRWRLSLRSLRRRSRSPVVV